MVDRITFETSWEMISVELISETIRLAMQQPCTVQTAFASFGVQW
jgi:hypothetical protein